MHNLLDFTSLFNNISASKFKQQKINGFEQEAYVSFCLKIEIAQNKPEFIEK